MTCTRSGFPQPDIDRDCPTHGEGGQAAREQVAAELAKHHPTRGMSVSMGVTCECGYWTGSEPEAGKRPLPWGRDQLDLHRADVVAALLDG